MKKLIATMAILTLISVSCKAQHVIPVEDGYKYVGSEKGFMGDNDYVYVKDINNILPKFLGTWKGSHESKNYEVKISKITVDDGELREDTLIMHYMITDNRGAVIENTLDLPNNSPFVLKNGYVAKTGSYVFSYIGRDVACGQNGSIFFSVQNTSQSGKAKIFLQVEGEKYPECTTGTAKQVFPVTSMELTKQK